MKLVHFCYLDRPHKCGEEIEVLADFEKQMLYFKCKKCGGFGKESLLVKDDLPEWMIRMGGCRNGKCLL